MANAVRYHCEHCDQENWTEDSRAGSMRECKYCGKLGKVPGKDKLAHLAGAPKPRVSTPNPEFKTCKHCAETDIKFSATVCKHCGKNPDGNSSGCLFYMAMTFLILGVLIFPALLVPGLVIAVIIILMKYA